MITAAGKVIYERLDCARTGTNNSYRVDGAHGRTPGFAPGILRRKLRVAYTRAISAASDDGIPATCVRVFFVIGGPRRRGVRLGDLEHLKHSVWKWSGKHHLLITLSSGATCKRIGIR